MKYLTAVVILTLVTLTAAAADFSCTVTTVADGDTLNCRNSSGSYRIRLSQIDAPEKGQPFGKEAKKQLQDLVGARHIFVKTAGRDRYRRVLGEIYLNKHNINLIMVARGYAWAYLHYLDDFAYLAAQNQAKSRRLGLWHERQPMPPWQWRKLKSQQKKKR